MKLTWQHGVILCLNLLALIVIQREAPRFLEQCFPLHELHTTDFVQDWTSTRNYREGLPVYWPLRDSLRYHLQLNFWFLHIHYNAHPPTSVLFLLPLGWLDYATAFIVWNVISLAALAGSFYLAGRTWHWRFPPWSWLPAIALALVFNPLSQQMMQGQMNGMLLFLLVLCWWGDRTDRPMLAGIALALAMSIKLYPGFLLLHFAVQKRWRLLTTAVLGFGAWVLASVGVLGLQTYVDYVRIVMPEVQQFKMHVVNASLNGFWNKLLGQASAQHLVAPLMEMPLLAKTGLCISLLTVAASSIYFSWHANTPERRDLAVGANLIAMLLLSPVTWEHTQVMLLPWLMQLWRWSPERIIPKSILVLIWLSMLINHVHWWRDRFAERWPKPVVPLTSLIETGGGLQGTAPGLGGPAAIMFHWQVLPHFAREVDLVTTGMEVLTWRSVPCYTLLGLLVFVYWVGKQLDSKRLSPAASR